MMKSDNISEEKIVEQISNKDIVRMVLWFCSEKVDPAYRLTEDTLKIFKNTTKLQKLIFLSQYELKKEYLSLGEKKIFSENGFAFKADSFGPYSNDLSLVTDNLVNANELLIQKIGNKTIYAIREKFLNEILKSPLINLLETDKIFLEWLTQIRMLSQLTLDQLLRHIYTNKNYREFLTRSRIVDRYSD
jgi:uncharacterized protein YwgA